MNTLVRGLLPASRLTLRQFSKARFSVAVGSKDHIDSLVQDKKLVVFMKGTPDAPRCGFSNAVVQILKFHGVSEYGSHDVLQDENLRQGIKDYSSWPTIPQVYMNGEFLGGCDILLEMHQNGEFIDELKKIGVRSALMDDPNKKAE